MNNSLIEDIINTQFQHLKKYNTLDVNMLGKEDILLSVEDNSFRIQANQELNHGLSYRLEILLPYFANFISIYKPLNFKIILGLGDIVNKEYNTDIPVICLSKEKHINGILIPNIDFFTGLVKVYLDESSGDTEYSSKKNESLFIGSSTGNFENNIRAQYCIKCLNKNNHHGYINNLCQNTRELWSNKYPSIEQTIHDSMSIKNQLQYKLLINIDGNTCCWSRLYWQMNSNSVPIYINRNTNDIQFFDYYDHSNGFISCSFDEAFDIMDQLLTTENNKIIDEINIKGKEDCQKMFTDYTKSPKVFLQNVINNILQKFL
jgi:hypothetical protein